MKHWLLSGLFIGGFALFVLQTTPGSQAQESMAVVEPEPEYTFEFSALPTISAKSFLVFDIETGEVVFGDDIHTPRPIASVTKLFTASAAEEGIQLEQKTVISQADVDAEGRAGKLSAGEEYSYRELLFPLLLESSNDAASVFEKVVDKVPETKTVLADASGLSSKNQASAADLADDLNMLYHEHRHVFDITTLKQYVGEDIEWVNNSPVRDLPGYKGGKHGYTEAANRTLVAVFEEEKVGDREFGYVLLGSNDIRSDLLALRETLVNSARLE